MVLKSLLITQSKILRNNELMIKTIKKYLISIRGLIWLLTKLNINKKLKHEIFNTISYDKVHIVLPGPTGEKIIKSEFNSNECIIFVNHAIKLANQVNTDIDKYSFLADTTRAIEVMELFNNQIKATTSIFMPYNFIHLRRKLNLLSRFSIYLMPEITFNFKLGLECKNRGAINFKSLDIRPCGYGFGTLCFVLQLAYLFKPKIINTYGCNFGLVSNKRYFDETLPLRSDTPYEKIKLDFEIIKKIIEKKNIAIEML